MSSTPINDVAIRKIIVGMPMVEGEARSPEGSYMRFGIQVRIFIEIFIPSLVSIMPMVAGDAKSAEESDMLSIFTEISMPITGMD